MLATIFADASPRDGGGAAGCCTTLRPATRVNRRRSDIDAPFSFYAVKRGTQKNRAGDIRRPLYCGFRVTLNGTRKERTSMGNRRLKRTSRSKKESRPRW